MNSNENHPEQSPQTAPLRKGALIAAYILICAAVAALAFIIFWPSYTSTHGGERSRVSRVQSDLRAIMLALENYYVDCSAYPACAIRTDSANSSVPADSPVRSVPTFMSASPTRPKLWTLTTPIAYLSSYPLDPFAPAKGAMFAYYVGGEYRLGWILYSAGPDMKYDIVPWEDYEPGELRASLINHTYDPTNGLGSTGDVYKIKQ